MQTNGSLQKGKRDKHYCSTPGRIQEIKLAQGKKAMKGIF
jgi:hypothetical protein